MVKWTIFIAAYTAGCIWLSMRRMEASGTGPMTPRGRLREMGWGLALLALTVSLFGLNGVNHWPTLIAILSAGLVLVLLPRQAAWLVAVMLITLGLYGFLLVGAYQRGYSVQKLYGLVLAGAGSYRTEFVLPQTYVFLVLGLWLLWRTAGRHSGLVKLLPGRKPWWGLLLLPVAAVAIELAGPDYGFSPGWWSILWNLAAAAAVLLIVWWFPAVAADLAAAGLIALGLYGIAVALSWPSAPFVTHGDALRFGAVLVDNPTWAAGAGLEGGLMLALGLWLVPRTVIPHARVLLRREPDADLAGRVEQLTQTRADAVGSAAAELRRVERDLHDGAQARLVALGMSLRAAEHLIPTSPTGRGRAGGRGQGSLVHGSHRAARPGPRHLPPGAGRPRPGRGGPGAGPGHAAAHRDRHCPARTARRAGRVRVLLRGRRGAHQRGQALRRPPRPGPDPARPRHAAGRGHRRRLRRRRPGPGQRPGRDRAAAGYIRRHPGRQQPTRRADHDRHGGTVRAVLAEDLFLLRDGLVRLLEAHDFEIAATAEDAPGARGRAGPSLLNNSPLSFRSRPDSAGKAKP